VGCISTQLTSGSSTHTPSELLVCCSLAGGGYVACAHTASHGRNWYYDTCRARASNL